MHLLIHADREIVYFMIDIKTSCGIFVLLRDFRGVGNNSVVLVFDGRVVFLVKESFGAAIFIGHIDSNAIEDFRLE